MACETLTSRLLLGVLALAVGCGSDEPTPGGGGSQGETETPENSSGDVAETEGDTERDTDFDTDADTDFDTDADTETEGDTEIDDPFEACAAEPVDHSADCGEGCPILFDARVTCDAYAFGDPGLRVAPAANSTVLVTSSDESAWMMHLRDDGMDAQILPEVMSRKTIHLALDAEGTPVLAADTTQALGFEGGVTVLLGEGPDFETEDVYEGDVFAPVFNTEMGSDGRLHVWFSSDPPEGRTESIRDANGEWTSRNAPVPGTSGWQMFTVDSDGESVGFDFVEGAAGTWSLAALSGGATQTMSDFYPDYPGARVSVAPPPMPPLEVEGPAYVTLVEHDDGLRVSWPTDDGFEEWPLEGTAPIAPTCVVEADDDGNCFPKSCTEVGTGVEPIWSAIARTSDGRVWAAWMRTNLDLDLTFTASCDPEVGCFCNSDVTRDDSWGELVLAEVDLETRELREAFVLRDANPHGFGLFSSEDSARALDLRAWGSELAIGTRVRDEGIFDPGAIRVLRVDTASIE